MMGATTSKAETITMVETRIAAIQRKNTSDIEILRYIFPLTNSLSTNSFLLGLLIPFSLTN